MRFTVSHTDKTEEQHKQLIIHKVFICKSFILVQIYICTSEYRTICNADSTGAMATLCNLAQLELAHSNDNQYYTPHLLSATLAWRHVIRVKWQQNKST